MKTSRIYVEIGLQPNSEIVLTNAVQHYLLRVLRMRMGDRLRLFNGKGGEYKAELIAADKKTVTIRVHEFIEIDRRSPLQLHLGQGISRGERMDYVIQKAVELGVNEITPLFTERCNVRIPETRIDNKMMHWRRIMQSACEQSGRCHLVTIHQPQPLQDWLMASDVVGFVGDPDVLHPMNHYADQQHTQLRLLLGPEGGLSHAELAMAKQHPFHAINFGPRVLRTETATVVAISLLQYQWGDL